MKLRPLLLVTVLLSGLVLPTRAQQASPLPQFSLAYLGNNLWNPGLLAGHRHYLATGPWYLSSQAGAYWDPGAHTATFVHTGIGLHLRQTKPWSCRLALHPLGYYRAWLANVYVVATDGSIGRQALSSRGYFAADMMLGLEKSLAAGGALLFEAHLQPLSPRHGHWLPLFHLAIGYTLSAPTP